MGIKSIQKHSSKIQQQIDKGKVSAKKLESLQGNLAENNQKMELLTLSLQDIKAIGEAPEVYRLTGPSSDDGTHGVVRDDSGFINIEGSNTGMHLHEIRHIGQSFERDGVRFDDDGYLRNPAYTKQEARNNEVEAYRVQFSYDSSYPAPSGARSLKYINDRSLMDIRLPDGKRLYKALED